MKSILPVNHTLHITLESAELATFEHRGNLPARYEVLSRLANGRTSVEEHCFTLVVLIKRYMQFQNHFLKTEQKKLIYLPKQRAYLERTLKTS